MVPLIDLCLEPSVIRGKMPCRFFCGEIIMQGQECGTMLAKSLNLNPVSKSIKNPNVHFIVRLSFPLTLRNWGNSIGKRLTAQDLTAKRWRREIILMLPCPGTLARVKTVLTLTTIIMLNN